MATIEVGMKNTKFVACAMCCSTPINIDKHRIKMVPPPIPIPLTNPDTIPTTISFMVSPLFLSNYHSN